MDSFQQRMRTELMYELRQLAHSNRPVTGQSHRETLQQFILANCLPEQQQENKSLHENVNNVEQHRPEAVIVEVQGVVEQRRVSSVLQSSAFRRQLENVIRGSIVSSQRQRVTRGLDSQVVRNRNSPTPTTTLPTLTDTERELQLPQLQRSLSSDSLSSLDSFSSATSNFEDEDQNSSSNAAQLPFIQSESRPQRDTQLSPVDNNEAEVLEEPFIRATNDVQPDYIQEEQMHQLHQEGLVEEISELLHSRLVSSAMEGEFRATLEVLVEDRLSSSGTNGQAVQNIIQNLPPSGIIRNDFSHLGIPASPMQDNSDNISVTGMSAQSVPYIQTNTYLSREVRDLKAQIMEMKNMIKLTFDLQIDLQRAVRQEVAAAMNRQHAGPSSAPEASRPVDDTHCLICLDRHSDCVLYRCGHLCVCYFCGRDLVSRNLGCPVCRAPIQDVIRAYKTNAE